MSELTNLRMRVDEEMARRDELDSGLGYTMDALDEAAAALEAIARGADPSLADEAAQNARNAAGRAREYIPDWEG